MGEYLKSLFIAPNRLAGGEVWGELCDSITNHTSPAWVEAGCNQGAAFGFVQIIFLLLAYGFILFKASNLISDGSELLLLVPSMRNLVGSIVLPILGAVPDGAIVLFSGLGDNAQEEVAVGVGALAGSTVMLLTLPWALSILAGRVDINNGKAQYTRPNGHEGMWSKLSGNNSMLFGTGIQARPAIKRSAIIMLITSVSYLLIQGPAFFSSAHGMKKHDDADTKHAAHLEKYWALTGFLVCVILFVAYLAYQVMVAQTDEGLQAKIEKEQAFAIKNGTITLSTLFYDDLKKVQSASLNEQTALLESSKNNEATRRMIEVLKGFFNQYDVNKDNHIDLVELQQLLSDLGEKITSAELDALIGRIDTDHDGQINFQEFVDGMPSFILDRVENRVPSQVKFVSEDGNEGEAEEEEAEEIPDDLVHLDPAQIMHRVKFRAFWKMAVGTLVVLLFSDPMVDVLSDVGKRLSIPAFYISFILAPIASNASELLASFSYAAKKTRKTITISMLTLLGAAIMNNTFCLGIFLFLIFARGMAWQFSAETISILFVELCMFGFAMIPTQRAYHAFIVMSLLPISLILVYVLEANGLD